MERDVLSVRQLMILAAVPLLGSAASLLLRQVSRLAEGLGWLVIPCAVGPVLLSFWICAGLCRSGEGLGAAFARILGPRVGKSLIGIYMVYVLLLLTVQVSLCAGRLAGARGVSAGMICAAAGTALALWLTWGKVEVFARAGEIFCRVLLVLVAGVLALAAGKVVPENLVVMPKEWGKLWEAWAFSGGVFLWGGTAAFLMGKMRRREDNGRHMVCWFAAVGVVGGLLFAAVAGGVGPGLTARLPQPFLVMVQGLGLKGAFQRMEGFVSAVWMLADIVFFGLLLSVWKELAKGLKGNGGAGTEGSAAAAAAVAVGAALVLTDMSGEMMQTAGKISSTSGWIFGFWVPVAVKGAELQKKKRG